MGRGREFKDLNFPTYLRGWEEVGKWRLGMDEAMKAVVAKMRADFVRVADVRKARGDWSEADQQEIGAAIKAAVDKGDPDMISSWALWLADLSCSIAAWDLIVRGSVSRMRSQAQQERKDRELASGALPR